jgi:hypothetical protein
MLRMRLCTTALFAALALATALPATAQIYKWKDAKGVTHYSESPPPKGAYSTQDMPRATPTSAPAASNAASAPKSADPRCDTARKNLVALQGKGQVQRDVDNDGKPDKVLTDSERSGEVELARATLKAYNCSETTASVSTGSGEG